MATPSRQEGDLHVNGHLTSKTAALPAGTLTDDMVNASAGLSVTKMRHQYTKKYADESATAASDQSRVLHIVHGTTGEVLAFKAGAIVANTGGTAKVDIDLEKNGTTILTTTIT